MPKYDKSAWNPTTYSSFDELKNALDQFEAAHQRGTLKTTGGWSAGQIFEHCAVPMRLAFDGFFDDEGKQINFPWFIKLAGVLVFKPMLGRSHMRPGIKLPASASSMLPSDGCTFEQGIEALRTQLARADAGEKMLKPSPLLGKMTHEKWILLHLDHCRMHFVFISCE